MADNHVVNVLVNLRSRGEGLVKKATDTIDKAGDAVDRLAEKQKGLKKSSDDLTKSQKDLQDSNTKLTQSERDLLDSISGTEKELTELEKTYQKIDKAVEQTVRDEQRYQGVLNSSKTSIGQKANALNELHNIDQKRLALEQEKTRAFHESVRQANIERRVLEQQKTVKERIIDTHSRLSSSYQRLTDRIRESTKAGEDQNSVMGRLRRTLGESEKSSKNLERRLALLGRAMLGLAIASVVIFMQSFASILVALVGHAIALAGSLAYAAGVLGGVFVGAVAQAIPVVGLLAAAFQRLSLIGEALTAQEAERRQSFKDSGQTDQAAIDRANQIADAQRSVRDAQIQLTEARADARRELEDLILAEREAELAMRGAVLSQQEARQSFRDTIQSGDVGGFERERLGVAQSNLGVRESRLGLGRARQELRQAQSGGIENMDQVINATRQLEDAERNLADAHKATAASAAEQSAQEGNLAFILKQLTPVERKLYETILRLKKRAERELRPITDIIIGSFVEGIEKAEEVIFSNEIIAGLTKLAEEMADQFGRVSDVLTSSKTVEFFTKVLKDGRENLEPLTDIAINLFKVFRNIATAVAPVLHKFLKLIADETERWVDSTKDREGLEQFFRTGLRHLRAWYGLLTAVIELFGALFGASQQSALKSIDDFTKRIQGATDYVEEHRKEVSKFFDQTGKAVGFVIDIIVALGQELVKSFDPKAVRAFRDILIEIVIPAIGEAVRILGRVIIELDKFLGGTKLGEFLKIALAFRLVAGGVRLLIALLVPLVGYIGNAIDALVTLANALGFKGTASVLRFAGVVGVIIAAIIIFRDEIVELGKIVFSHLEEPIEDLIDAFNQLFDSIGSDKDLNGMKGAWQDIVHFFEGEIFEAFKKFANGLGRALGGTIKIITGFIKILTGDFSGIGDIFEGILDNLIGTFEMFTAPFRQAGETIGNAFKNALVGAFELAKDVVVGIADKILGLWSTVLGKIGSVLDDLPTVDLPGFEPIDFGAPGDALEEAASNIDEFRENLRGEEEDVDKAEKATKRYTRSKTELGQATEDTGKKTSKAAKEEKQLGKDTKEAAKEQEKQGNETRKLDRKLGILIDTLFGSGKQSSELGRVVKEVTNNVLSAFGVKELKFQIPSAKEVGKAVGTAASFIGSIFESGGWIGHPHERGPDDRLIGVAGGEAILTGHQQKAVNMAMAYGNMAGVIPYRDLNDLFSKDRRQHKTSGYATGGIVPLPGFPGESANRAIIPELLNMVRKFNLFVTDVYGPGHQSIEHTRLGTAADIVPGPGGSWALVDKAVAAAVKAGYTPVYYDGRFGSIAESGHGPPSVAGSNAHAHITFLTAAELGSGATPGGIGGLADHIKRIKVKGPDGPLKDMLQGQSDELRKAANKKIQKELGSLASLGDFGSNLGAGSLTEAQVRRIFLQAFRITGVTPRGGNLSDLMNLAYEESTWNPRAQNRTPAGIAAGLPQGILQVVGATFAAAAQQARQRNLPVIPTDPFNPLHNAIASIIYQMGKYGDIQRHAPYARGGQVPEFADGGIVPGPLGMPTIAKVHGGETVLPTHKYQSGGRTSVRRALRNIRRTIRKDGAFSDTLQELLREGGLFDDLAEAIDFFVAAQARSISEFAYRIRRGMVVQIKSHEAIARRQLETLEDTGKFLNRELLGIEKLMRQTKERLRRADSSKERKLLRTALNNLEQRAGEVGDALAQNLSDRIDAQNSIFQAFIDRIQSKIGLTDLRQQIIELQGEISGNIDIEAITEQFETRGSLLEKERERIRRELRRAESRGDRERVLELEQALLENKLAILENTKSLDEINGTLGEVFDFNSTPWQLFRVAVLNGMGGLMPGLSIPSLHTGGIVTGDGLFNLKAGETVSAPGVSGDTNINITSPMEVADPVALSNAIAFKLKTMSAR